MDDLMSSLHGHYDQFYVCQNEYGLFVAVKSRTDERYPWLILYVNSTSVKKAALRAY
jgi:hypothetical protein